MGEPRGIPGVRQVTKPSAAFRGWSVAVLPGVCLGCEPGEGAVVYE
jgi:hypothetical protein